MKLSVLGDSYSTFEGFSNNVIDPAEESKLFNYYPRGEVGAVSDTWWAKVCEKLGGTMVSNDSIAGTCVADYNITPESRHESGKWCMNQPKRICDLGDSDVSSPNHPDIIMVFGGTNDMCREQFGIDKTEAQIKEATDLFVNTYSNVIRQIFERYSSSITILCITPCHSSLVGGNERALNAICGGIGVVVEHYRQYGYDCKLVNTQKVDLTQGMEGENEEEYSDGHPNALGMSAIAARVIDVQLHEYQPQ